MKIRNLTSETQGLRLVYLDGNEGFTIYIEPKGISDVQGAYIADKSKFDKGILEIVSPEKTSKASEAYKSEEELNDEAPAETLVEDSANEAEELVSEEGKDSPKIESTTAPEKFICKECGAEFASERGLNTHMNRVHA